MSTFTTRPEILGTFGVVASTHWLGTAVGMSILEKGGNAFDAAVATGFMLQVAEPHLCGPGGEVPLILYDKKKDAVEVICGQGSSPAAATIDYYTGLGLNMMPGNGLLAAVIPGAFDAWMLLLRDYGTMSVREVLEPAIGYAKNGVPVVPKIKDTVTNVQYLFENEWKTSADVFLPNGAPPVPGSLFAQPKMAASYERIIKESEAVKGSREKQVDGARDAFYRGFVAEAIDAFCRNNKVIDTSGQYNNGLITADDMAAWSATVEKPLMYDYNEYTVCKTGPWGQGPVMLQNLALLKGYDIGKMSATDPEFIHTVVECSKLAYADREAFYGDPDFVDVPFDVLLSDKYNDERRKLVGKDASLELRPGSVPGFGGDPVIRDKSMDVDVAHAGAHGVGEPTTADFSKPIEADAQAPGDTVHFDIIDKDGNMISGTPSGGWLQSSPTIPELGFCLTTRGQMYWLIEGLPSSLAPKKRPRTTLTPSFALRDGKPYMAFGTPGGDQQDQWSLQLFLRHAHFGMNLQQAIDAPTFNTKHFPSSFYPREWDPGHLAVEGRFPKATIDELKKRGHKVVVEDDWGLGRLTAATKDGDMLKAAANPRHMQGYAAGR
ncbi:MAG: gamma-glutamyltransferase family protein [Rhodospirillales bacterium]